VADSMTVAAKNSAGGTRTREAVVQVTVRTVLVDLPVHKRGSVLKQLVVHSDGRQAASGCGHMARLGSTLA